MARIVRVEFSSWQRLRDVRLIALRDAPDAFGSSLSIERSRTEAEWRRALELGPWWVAEADGHDVGLVAGGHHHATGAHWVYSMWVDGSHRGTEVAEQLCEEVIHWAQGEGARLLGLDVTDRVPRARRFYERIGFVANGRVATLPRDPSIALVEMELDLSSVTGLGGIRP